MDIDIALSNGPLALPVLTEKSPDEGALVHFEGRVRAEENGRSIPALEYEAYEPMARQEMERIARELARQHPCLALRVRHRVGRVPVGEAAIVVEVRARHRGEAFSFVAGFMNRLKQDVPIWKKEATS